MVIPDKLKKIILYVLALIAFCACGVFVLLVFDLFLDFEQSTISLGMKSGAIAWVAMFIIPLFKRNKNMEQ